MTQSIATITLKPGKERALLRRHPWVYATGVASASGRPKSGQTVRVQDSKKNFLAWAAFSPESALRARCWSFNETDVIDENWIDEKIRLAIAAREPLRSRTNAIRLIFGEADFLPGLIVDQYNNQIVTQFQSAGVEYWRAEIGKSIVRHTGISEVYDRSDAATRAREGLPVRKEVDRKSTRLNSKGTNRPKKSKSLKTGSNTAWMYAKDIKPAFMWISATTVCSPVNLPRRSAVNTAGA